MTGTPLLVSGVAAGVGALILAILFGRMGRRAWAGAALGAVAGVLGSLMFMAPLNYCTFEPERRPVDNIIGVVLVIAGMLILLLPLAWIAERTRDGWAKAFVTPSLAGSFKGGWWAFVLLAPTLFILILFLYYPSLNTLWLSTQASILGIPGTYFVCVDNFAAMITNPGFGRTLYNTAFITIAVVALSMTLSLLIALAAYQPIKGARIYRTLLIWPYAISPVVAGIIFLLLFNPTGGIINYALELIGIEGPPWLRNPAFAPWAVILASVWKAMGFNILFYIAGLQNVPADLKEAAAIDGANVFQRFRFVVIPLLSPITFFLLITNTTYAIFETFGTIDFLTAGGGPRQSTETLMYSVYRTWTQNSDLGSGAAQSIVLFLIVIGLTIFQFRTSGSKVNYGS